MITKIASAALLAAVGVAGASVTPGHPSRADAALQTFEGRCGAVHVSIERILRSRGAAENAAPVVVVNEAKQSGQRADALSQYLAVDDALYSVNFLCHESSSMSVVVSRASGSRSGVPSYSKASAFFSPTGMTEFRGPETAAPDTFWLR